jgi:hypothetical protein
LTTSRRTLLAAAACLYLLVLARPEYNFASEFAHTAALYERQAGLARQLDRPELHGVLMSSEAGLRPYFSRWWSIDPWGLNTPEFATHLIQPQEVAALHPDLVVLHVGAVDRPCNGPLGPSSAVRTWDNMLINIQRGMGREHYEIWLIEDNSGMEGQTAGSSECWYVAKSYHAHIAVGELLRSYGGVLQDSPGADQAGQQEQRQTAAY